MYLSFVCAFLMSFVIICGGKEEFDRTFVMQRLLPRDAVNISETSRCGDLRRVKSLVQFFRTNLTFSVDRYIKDCTSPILLRSNVTRRDYTDQRISNSTDVTEEEGIIECRVESGNESMRLFFHMRETKLDFTSITYFPSILIPYLSNSTTAYVASCYGSNVERSGDLYIIPIENIHRSAKVVQYLYTEEPIISLKIHHTHFHVHSLNTSLKTLTRRLFIVLNQNASTFLHYRLLNNFTALDVFDISDNGLFSIPEDLLQFNSQLQTCDLSSNSLREIHPSFFTHTIKLKILALEHNQLQTLPSDLFINNKGLETLSLNHNQLRYLPSTLFVNNFKLLNLRLDHNQLQTLPSDLFINNKGLELLLLNHNQLRYLPSTLFVNNFKLSNLRLSHNRLVDLPRTLFPKNNSLIQLNLSHNQLKDLNLTLLDDPLERRIEEDPKFKLPKLFTDIQGWFITTENFNEDKKVDPNTSLKTNTLVALNVSHNRIKSFPQDLFKHSQFLRYFDGSYNPEIFSFDNSKFLYSLEIITFTDGNIEYIEGILSNINPSFISPIKLVEFSRNKINSIDSTAFRNCHKLQMIFLKDNQLTRLEPELFKDLENLYYLNLSGNMLYTLPYQLFRLQSLLYLNVSRNHISDFGPSPLITVLQSFTSHLRELDLSNNCLTSSEIAPLNISTDTPLHLTYINIEFNALVNIPIIPTAQTGYYVYLGHNVITDIETSNLENWAYGKPIPATKSSPLLMAKPRSVLVSLCPNPLKRICKFQNKSCEVIKQERLHDLYNEFLQLQKNNCYDEISENYTSRYFRRISFGCPFTPTCSKMYYQSLLCYGNISCDLDLLLVCPITESCPSLCKCYKVGFKQMTVVNCRECNLTTLPLLVPPNINILHFEHNKLRNLSQFTASIWSHLTQLYLDNNEISDANLQHLPPTIQKLSMKQNRIQTLNVNRIEEMFTHLQISLSGNPWLCDCSALELITLIRSSEIIIDGRDILCNKTKHPLVDIDEEEICAEKLKFATNVSLAVSIGILLPMLVGLIAVFYYRNKRTIAAYIFTHHPRIFECFFSRLELDEQKRFDAFISYSGSDTDVVKQFIQQLEEREPSFSLCIHERDWLAGNDISVNIANSVSMSRKTILILSKEFLKSMWFTVELQSAYYQSVEDRVDRLIIVLKGDLPSLNTLHIDLQVLLKTKTYLVWGEKWFWEKLRYALSQSKT